VSSSVAGGDGSVQTAGQGAGEEGRGRHGETGKETGSVQTRQGNYTRCELLD